MTATRLNPTTNVETWSTGTFPVSSTTSSYVNATKYGGVVVLDVRLTSSTATSKGGWYTIGTLPQGWRPRNYISSVVYTTDGSAFIGILDASADGTVKVHSSGAANKSWRGSVTFMV